MSELAIPVCSSLAVVGVMLLGLLVDYLAGLVRERERRLPRGGQ